jgi:hypothetical protein
VQSGKLSLFDVSFSPLTNVCTGKQLRSEVIKELEAELDAEMLARGESVVATPPAASIPSNPALPRPSIVTAFKTSKPSRNKQRDATGFTFGSVKQVPVKRKVIAASSSVVEDSLSDVSSDTEAEFEGIPSTSSDVCPLPAFPPEVMDHSDRRKMLSQLLQSVRRHLEIRQSKQAKKRSKSSEIAASLDESGAPQPVPMAPADVAGTALGIEAALFRLDGSCSEVWWSCLDDKHNDAIVLRQVPACGSQRYFSQGKSLIHHLGDRDNPSLHHAVCTGVCSLSDTPCCFSSDRLVLPLIRQTIPPDVLVRMMPEQLGGSGLAVRQAAVE